MYSIQVVIDYGLVSGNYLTSLINHFDTLSACTEYLGTTHFKLYQSWINYWFIHFPIEYSCVYTGI